MKLILLNGYPFPCPEGFDPEATGYDCRAFELTLVGVRHFEWKHELTIEFDSRSAYDAALAVTNWEEWDRGEMILSASVSAPDGYGHPAIVVCDRAYCGFILIPE